MSVYQAVFEKSEGQTDKQNDKPTKQKDYTSPALAGAGDYNKKTIAPDIVGDYNKQTDRQTKQKDYRPRLSFLVQTRSLYL